MEKDLLEIDILKNGQSHVDFTIKGLVEDTYLLFKEQR